MIRLTHLALAATLLAAAAGASADTLVDRGLPTANLNNAALAARSNVAWVDGGFSPNAPTTYTLLGDSFTNSSSANWAINTIRVWVVGSVSSVNLLGGVAGGAMGQLSTGYTSTSNVMYSNATTYQGTSGSDIAITAIDFSVNISLAMGQTLDFFLDGTGGAYGQPFMHASNAALSGSPQDGSDNEMLSALFTGGALSNIEGFTSLNNGWDKASDFNVQVIGNTVPEPSSLALVGLALAGIGAAARRRKA